MKENELVKFRRERVGFIFQSFHLLGTMNALENVALPLSFRGVPKSVRLKKADQMLNLVNLSKHKKHFPNQPTGNLDSHTSEEVMHLMQKVVREQKKTLVMVTHDEHLASYADRIFHIMDGKIVRIEDNREIHKEEQQEKKKESEEKDYEKE